MKKEAKENWQIWKKGGWGLFCTTGVIVTDVEARNHVFKMYLKLQGLSYHIYPLWDRDSF